MIPPRWRPALDTRRAASTLLVVCGSLFVVMSATSVARAAIARDAARARWAEMEAQREVARGRIAADHESPRASARGAPVLRLMIPRVELDEVVVEGVGESELRAGPGHMIGSVLPGDSGTAVISAHRDRHFHALDRIRVGDTVLTESERGTIAWTVTRTRVVDADAPALHSSATPLLVLTTCWPIRYFGPAPDRLIVEAIPITGSGKREAGSESY